MAHNYQDKHSAQHIEHIPNICQSKLYDSKQDVEVEEKIKLGVLWEQIYYIIEKNYFILLSGKCSDRTIEVQYFSLHLLKTGTLEKSGFTNDFYSMMGIIWEQFFGVLWLTLSFLNCWDTLYPSIIIPSIDIYNYLLVSI